MLKELVLTKSDVKMKLATGYLNLQKEYIKEVIKADTPGKFQILTSSPRANGFYRGGIFKKYIPGLYRVNEEKLLKQAKSSEAIQMHEYESSGWTFHGKGAWIYEGSDVTMSVIGSSNFSYRSNRRDTEC